MCRICGRMIKCIFDSMPSRSPTTLSRPFTRALQQPASKRHISSKALLQSTFYGSSKSSKQPPTFIIPFRAKLHSATVKQAEATSPAQFHQTEPQIPPPSIQSSETKAPTIPSPDISTTDVSSFRPMAEKPLVLSKSLQALLPNLVDQTPHYITAHIHRFPYLLTAGDTLRLPFHLHGVSPGDILRFNRASLLGSRDYTLKAGLHSTESYDKKRTGEPNYIDERLFECRMRVLGIESTPMMIKEKKKRRIRRTKTVKSKHKYTVLRVMEVRAKGLEELKSQESGVLVLE